MALKIFSKDSTESQKTVIVLIILFVVLITSGFYYVDWDIDSARWISYIVFTMIFIYYLNNIKYTYNANFKSVILLLTFIPFLSSINAYMKYGQNLFDSYLATVSNFIWLLYFFFHKWRVKEATLLRVFLLLSFFIFVVQVYQNLYPDNAVFGLLYTEGVEERNGILRYRMGMGGYFSMPILLAFLCFIKKELMDLKMLVIVVMILFSIYLTLTRQVIATCIFVVFLSFFIARERKSSDYIIILLMIIGLYFAYDVLFAKLSEKTMDEATDENIRVIVFSYYFDRDTEDIFAWLIGHGMPKCDSFVSDMKIQKEMFLYTSDIGFIGKWFYMGFPYIFICYYFLYLLFWKYKKSAPTYIRLFVIYGSVMSVMIFPMDQVVYSFVWTIIAYITDLHINNSPLALENTKVARIE